MSLGDIGKVFLVGVGVILLIAALIGMWGTGTYNGLVTDREGVKTQWGNVEASYQRRFDLIPNLVETVKGYAAHEKSTFQAVTEARSKVGGVMQLKPEDLTPENLAKFNQAQAGLSGALQRLMVGRTSFVIAQRLSTLRRADLILVLEKGRIAARGSHAELLRTSGLYAEIYHRQLRPQGEER